MYKRSALILVVAVLVAGSAVSQEWGVDAAHSSVGFSVSHLVISKTRGNFTDFDGVITFDGKNLAAGSVEFEIQMASVDTDDNDRDDHLRNADFFDVEKYPTMTFKSKKVIPGDGDEFQLVGDLTIKDVTKEVTFDCEFRGVMNDPWGNTRAGFSAETKIDRQEFNVSFNKTLDAGGLVVGDEVRIEIEVEAIKKG